MTSREPDYKKLYEESLHKQAQLEQQLALVMADYNELRRKLFGIRSDNRIKAVMPGQLELFTLGATEAVKQQIATELEDTILSNREQESVTPRQPRTAPRMTLPQTLEREDIVIDPSEDLSDYQVIGEEITEILVMVPTTFKVRRIIRRKWGLKNDLQVDKKGVLIAPLPSRTVKRGIFDESVLAHLLISKYIDHLPLYRQKKMFERQQIYIPPATLTDNTAAACRALQPIYHALRRETLDNIYLQADETTFKVQESDKKGSCHKGYLWAYHAPVDGLVFFEYQPGRDHAGLARTLADFHGVIQTDGYQVYKKLFKNNENVSQLFCMAHIRRKFDEAANTDPQRAAYVIGEIAKLYAIEKQIRESVTPLAEDQIVRIRMEQATPILNRIKEWMSVQITAVLPQSPIGKAIAYALELWDNMYNYTFHGHLQIDNNGIENTIRPIAIGRKNYLFAGTSETAQHAAIVYSLFATCKKHQVNPQEWLEDVLRKINDPEYNGKYADLMPHRWKK